MADGPLIERFRAAWFETFPAGKVPPPTNQQILGIVLLVIDHKDGQALWSEMVKTARAAFPESTLK